MRNPVPLVSRALTEDIAYLTEPLTIFSQAAGVINVQTFLSHVVAIAAILEDNKYAINLCANRYLFLVSFCAVIVRGQTNLLPPNKNITTQKKLNSSYGESYIIHDGIDISNDTSAIDLSSLIAKINDSSNYIPKIDSNHLAAISFTSGSTGDSKPNLKYWHTLYTSSDINYRHMIPNTEKTLYQLATMPAQHMWGLETSALMPLFHNICTCDAKPLYPQDIIDTLRCLPEPRMLVSTPVHLRALTEGNIGNLPLFLTLCATSPLTPSLAQKIEAQFSTILREVYGCSEVGSMAVRQTSLETEWRLFTGINFTQENDITVASGGHLPEAIPLQDTIKHIDKNHFILSGRKSDMVDIAGKRGSLFELNQVLLKFKHLNDGIIIFPESTKAIPRLCAIVSLKKGSNKKELNDYFRKHLDSAFIPRPIFVVDKIPREENGKLLKSKTDTLYQSLLKTHSRNH